MSAREILTRLTVGLSSLPLLDKALIVAAAVGLFCKFLLSYNLELDSDHVLPAMVTLEMTRHGYPLLDAFRLPADDPNIFSEILLFYAVPQYLSGFNPAILRLTGFAVFALIVTVFTLLTYAATKNRTGALATAALISCMSPFMYAYFGSPVTHNATILFAGIFALLFLDMPRWGLSKTLIMAVATALVTFSDMAILAYFFIPFTVYALLHWKKYLNDRTIVAAVAIFLASFALYRVKASMPQMVSSRRSLGEMVARLGEPSMWPETIERAGLYLQYMGRMIDMGASTLFGGTFSTSVLVVAALLILALVGLSALKSLKTMGPGGRYPLVLSGLSAALFFAVFTSTNYFEAYARYLAFSAFTVLVAAGILYAGTRKIGSLLVVVLAIGLVANLAAVAALDYQPNAREYRLIDCLEEQHLDHGYGNYWDSNIVTYLSDEKVRVRSAEFPGTWIKAYVWEASAYWYAESYGQIFIVEREFALPVEIRSKANRTLTCGEYNIYVYDQIPT